MSNRITFEERQNSSKSTFIWVLMIVSSVPVVILFGVASYVQLIKGVPWGNNPTSDVGLVAIMIGTLALLLIAAFITLGSSLQTKVTTNSIEYKYPPLLRKWQRIDPEAIARVFRQQRNLINKGSYRKTIFSSTVEISVLGWEQVCLVLKNGDKIILGTQSPDILEHEIKKLISREEN